MTTFLYTIIILYGIIIGSFLNVCIYRIPLQQNIVTTRSHCMNCGYQLRWYDLFPLFSYIALGGKCRQCKTKISIQYPLIEALNGILYFVIFLINGFNLNSVIYCLLTSALLVLSVIDFKIYEIPVGINYFILLLGLIHLGFEYKNWATYLLGLFVVSLFLLILFYITQGKGIGGGDIKLMAVAGLLLGWKLIILAFFLGCILGSIIHLIRMKVSKQDHVLAFGPYLSLGIFLAFLYGDNMIKWYMGICLG